MSESPRRTALTRVSLSIYDQGDSFEPHPDVLHGPAGYEPERSRFVLHETLHYWQQLSLGFMVRVAEEEWERLRAHERGEAPDPEPGPYAAELRRTHPSFGFTTYVLLEALTRFWDVHTCGPLRLLELEREAGARAADDAFWERYDALVERAAHTGPEQRGYSWEAYNLAMEGPGGAYARPYRRVIDATSPESAGIVFPVAAYLAFQTPTPTDHFVRFTEQLAAYVPRLFLQASHARRVEELWIRLYVQTVEDAWTALAAEGTPPLVPEAVVGEGSLSTNPLYAHLADALGRRCGLLYATDLPRNVLAARWAAGTGPGEPLDEALLDEALTTADDGLRDWLARATLDVLFATPGVSTHRTTLAVLFPPPVVHFADGSGWQLGRALWHGLVDELAGPLAADVAAWGTTDEYWEAMAGLSLALDRRWHAFVARETARPT